jgi:hypothetical protein
MSSSDHRQISVETDNRKFDVSILKYDNGFFISISEGAKKLGAMMMSVAAGPSPSSSEIIPIRHDSLFLKLISQKIASEVRGLCLVSLFTQRELGPDTSKILIEKIMGAVRN